MKEKIKKPLIVKKIVPESILNNMETPPDQKEALKTYYLIDGDIYVHTLFSIDSENMSLTLIHDLTLIETEMIKTMKSKGKMWLDKKGKPYFDLHHLALWFFWNIPSKDYQDLLGFLRILLDLNKMNKFIDMTKSPGVQN